MSEYRSALEQELMDLLSNARAPLPIPALRRRVTLTRHDSRIGNALRGLEHQGVARFTRGGGWELVTPDRFHRREP